MKVECVLGQSKAVSMAMSPLRISNCVARGGVFCLGAGARANFRYRYHAWQLPHYPGVGRRRNGPGPRIRRPEPACGEATSLIVRGHFA